MIPESQKQHNDLIDIIVEGSQKIEVVENEQGKLQKQLILDPETIYWKTHVVNSPTFARFVYELKSLEGLAYQCVNHMSRFRAGTLKDQILKLVQNFKYSIDAKSSESLRDRNNTQSTLIDKINKNKIEKAFTVKGEFRKSMLDGILGREGEREGEEN